MLGRKPETIGVRPATRLDGGAPRPRRRRQRPAPRIRQRRRRLRSAGAGSGRAAAAAPPPPGSGTRVAFNHPADVAWDKAGNIYVADGLGNNNRVAKFDKDGRFIAHWGSTGSGSGQFSGVKAIAIDAQNNVYVADMGNKRIQVFDDQGTFKSEIGNIGTPIALCLTTRIDAVSLRVARRRPGRNGRRRDLQGAARRQGRG